MLSQEEQKRAEYLLYEEKVRKLSEKNFREEYISNKNLRGKEFELDHKLSIKDGFEQNVPVEIMSDVLNLEVISVTANRSKGRKSTMTFSELIEQISDRDFLS